MKIKKPYNGRVDAAARFHSTIAEPIMMRNTLPPLASNDFFGRALMDGSPILARRASKSLDCLYDFANLSSTTNRHRCQSSNRLCVPWNQRCMQADLMPL